MFPLRRDEEVPLPKELLGLMPKVRPPPELDPPRSCWEKVPPEAESWRSVPLSSLVVGPASKEDDWRVASSGPLTLKKFAVSPMLSNDWLNSVKEGAMSSEFVC